MSEIERLVMENVSGFECRLLVIDGKPYVCVSDLYKQINIPKTTISSILSRNTDFENHIIKINGSDLQNDGVNPVRNLRTGFQKGTLYTFIDEEGYNLLIQRINPDIVQDEEDRKHLVNMQQEMASVYAKYKRGTFKEIPSKVNVPHSIVGDVFEQYDKIGDIMAKKFNLDPTHMTAVSLEATEKVTGCDMRMFKNMLPAARVNSALLRATDIGNELGIKPAEVNKILASMGFITRIGKKWDMTAKGHLHGDMVQETVKHPGGSEWSETLCKWKPEVIEIIKANVEKQFRF